MVSRFNASLRDGDPQSEKWSCHCVSILLFEILFQFLLSNIKHQEWMVYPSPDRAPPFDVAQVHEGCTWRQWHIKFADTFSLGCHAECPLEHPGASFIAWLHIFWDQSCPDIWKIRQLLSSASTTASFWLPKCYCFEKKLIVSSLILDYRYLQGREPCCAFF